MVSLKVYTSADNTTLLAACDKEHLGKTFTEGELKLEVKEDFYGGEVVELEIFEQKLKQADVANLVGEKVVSKAIELGLANSDSVIKIQGIPHAQIASI